MLTAIVYKNNMKAYGTMRTEDIFYYIFYSEGEKRINHLLMLISRSKSAKLLGRQYAVLNVKRWGEARYFISNTNEIFIPVQVMTWLVSQCQYDNEIFFSLVISIIHSKNILCTSISTCPFFLKRVQVTAMLWVPRYNTSVTWDITWSELQHGPAWRRRCGPEKSLAARKSSALCRLHPRTEKQLGEGTGKVISQAQLFIKYLN